jgi:hypothetical protein
LTDFGPIPALIQLFCLFFEKSRHNILLLCKKAVPLHSLSGSNRGMSLGGAFVAASRMLRIAL